MSAAYSRFIARKSFIESQAKLMGGVRDNLYSAFVFADEETTELFYEALADYDEAARLELRGFRRVEQAAAVSALRVECNSKASNVGNRRGYIEVDMSVWGTIKAVATALFFLAFAACIVWAVGYVIYDRIENGPPITINYVGDCERG